MGHGMAAGALATGLLEKIGAIDALIKGLNRWSGLNYAPTEWYLEAWLKGLATDKDLKWCLDSEGLDPGSISWKNLNYTRTEKGLVVPEPGLDVGGNEGLNGILLSMTEVPSREELMVLWNRGLISETTVDMVLSMLGLRDKYMNGALKNLRYEIPPTSDLIRWAVRHAFDVDIVEEFDYLAEVPTKLYALAAANGLGGPTGIQYPEGKDNEGKVLPAHEAKWFDMEWVAHWILPSTGQGYEMLHRLYGASRYGASPTATPQTVFGIEQMRTLLRAQDIPPFWRDRLIALSYSPLTRVDTRRMYLLDVIDEKEVYHSYRSQGYDDDNALRLTAFTKKQKIEQDKTKYGKPALKRLCKAYQQGTIDKPDLIASVRDITDDALETEVFVEGCDTDRTQKLFDQTVSLIRQQYIKGIIDDMEVGMRLAKLGVIATRRQEYVDRWSLQLAIPHREATAAQLVQWFKSGLLGDRELFDRLHTLGWSASDGTRIVALASNELEMKTRKASIEEQKKREADLKKANKEQEAGEKKQQQDIKAKIKTMIGGATEKNLISWWKKGLIQPSEVMGLLQLKGWEQASILRWMEDNKPPTKEGT